MDVEALPGQSAPPPAVAAAPSRPPVPAGPRAAAWRDGDDGGSPRLPDPATASFLTLLRLALLVPSRLLEASGHVPARLALRFGFLAVLLGVFGTSVAAVVAPPPVAPGVEQMPGWLVQSLAQSYGLGVDGVQRLLQCEVQQQRDWDELIRPWAVARVPLSPLLALALLHGLVGFFSLLASALGAGRSPYPALARSVAYSMAPMALAALPLFPFTACLTWSLVLCGMALRRTLGVPTLVAAGMAAVPLGVAVAVEFLVVARIAASCIPGG